MIAAGENTRIRLSHAHNQLETLQHKRFVENRVYDEDETLSNRLEVPTLLLSNSMPLSNLNTVQFGLKNCLKVVHKLYDKIELNLNDSDSEADDNNSNKKKNVYRLKNPYFDRPLPYLIGSSEWNKSWHIGLVDSDDSDVSIGDETEEYSESSDNGSSSIGRQSDLFKLPFPNKINPLEVKSNETKDIFQDKTQSKLTKVLKEEVLRINKEQITNHEQSQTIYSVNLFSDEPPDDDFIPSILLNQPTTPINLFLENDNYSNHVFDYGSIVENSIKNISESAEQTDVIKIADNKNFDKKLTKKTIDLFDNNVFDSFINTLNQTTTHKPKIIQRSKISSIFDDTAPDDLFDVLITKSDKLNSIFDHETNSNHDEKNKSEENKSKIINRDIKFKNEKQPIKNVFDDDINHQLHVQDGSITIKKYTESHQEIIKQNQNDQNQQEKHHSLRSNISEKNSDNKFEQSFLLKKSSIINLFNDDFEDDESVWSISEKEQDLKNEEMPITTDQPSNFDDLSKQIIDSNSNCDIANIKNTISTNKKPYLLKEINFDDLLTDLPETNPENLKSSSTLSENLVNDNMFREKNETNNNNFALKKNIKSDKSCSTMKKSKNEIFEQKRSPELKKTLDFSAAFTLFDDIPPPPEVLDNNNDDEHLFLSLNETSNDNFRTENTSNSIKTYQRKNEYLFTDEPPPDDMVENIKNKSVTNDGSGEDLTDQSMTKSFENKLAMFSHKNSINLDCEKQQSFVTLLNRKKLTTNVNINVKAMLPDIKVPLSKVSDNIDSKYKKKIINNNDESELSTNPTTKKLTYDIRKSDQSIDVPLSDSLVSMSTDCLVSLVKSRPKILSSNRRQSTRKGRQEQYRKSIALIDQENNERLFKTNHMTKKTFVFYNDEDITKNEDNNIIDIIYNSQKKLPDYSGKNIKQREDHLKPECNSSTPIKNSEKSELKSFDVDNLTVKNYIKSLDMLKNDENDLLTDGPNNFNSSTVIEANLNNKVEQFTSTRPNNEQNDVTQHVQKVMPENKSINIFDNNDGQDNLINAVAIVVNNDKESEKSVIANAKKLTSLFDEEDDNNFFVEIKEREVTPVLQDSKQSFFTRIKKSKGIFDDTSDDDLFSKGYVDTRMEKKLMIPSPMKNKIKLFDDEDDDDLFSTEPKRQNQRQANPQLTRVPGENSAFVTIEAIIKSTAVNDPLTDLLK